MAKYFFIAGEVSGDIHAAKVIRQIKRRYPEAEITGFGGERMQEAGCVLHRHIRHMAFMGFAAVLKHRKEIKENFQIAHEALLKEQPDALVLIDYPSFNLRIASFCKEHLPSTKIYYYIPPKVWAWKRRRIHRIAKLCDRVIGIFPFEPAFYAQYGYSCEYAGNPTVEEIEEQRTKTAALNEQRTKRIAILPGSRESEISHCLGKMLEAARQFKDYPITVVAAPGIEDSFYTPYLHTGERLARDVYEVLRSSSAAVVNSGTATLETALIGCPQVAVYHLSFSGIIRYIRWAQPLFFSIPYFTLVNIISGKEVIKECIADDFTVDKVSAELERLLHDERHKKEMLAEYEHLYSVLGDSQASKRVSEIITSDHE